MADSDDDACWILKGDEPNCGCGRKEHIIITHIKLENTQIVIRLENGVEDSVRDDMVGPYLFHVLETYVKLGMQSSFIFFFNKILSAKTKSQDQLVKILLYGEEKTINELTILVLLLAKNGYDVPLHHIKQ